MMIDPGDPRWTAYISNELEGEDREELEAELARSPEARRHLEELCRAADLLTEGLESPSGFRLKQSQIESVLRVARQCPVPWWRSLSPLDGTLQKVAALILLLGILAALLLPGDHRGDRANREIVDGSERLVSASPRSDILRDVVAPATNVVFRPPSYGLVCWSREDLPLQRHPFVTATEDFLASCYFQVGDESYRRVRRSLLAGRPPDPASVRVEELINYFPYDYSSPGDGKVLSVHMEMAGCPWNPQSRLLRVGLRGARDPDPRPLRILLVVDGAGMQRRPYDRALLVQAVTALRGRLESDDDLLWIEGSIHGNEAIRIASGGQTASGMIESFASLPSESTPDLEDLRDRIEAHLRPDMRNEVVLVLGQPGLALASEHSRILGSFPGAPLSVLHLSRKGQTDPSGAGYGENMLFRTVSNGAQADHFWGEVIERGNPVVAGEVHMQLRFDPGQVRGYRLVGNDRVSRLYRGTEVAPPEGHHLRAGREVTLFFEVFPAPEPVREADPTLSLDLVHRMGREDPLVRERHHYTDPGRSWWDASSDFKFCAAVAAYGILLSGESADNRLNPYGVLELAHQGLGMDPHGHRREFLEVVRRTVRVLGLQD